MASFRLILSYVPLSIPLSLFLRPVLCLTNRPSASVPLTHPSGCPPSVSQAHMITPMILQSGSTKTSIETHKLMQMCSTLAVVQNCEVPPKASHVLQFKMLKLNENYFSPHSGHTFTCLISIPDIIWSQLIHEADLFHLFPCYYHWFYILLSFDNVALIHFGI